MKEIKEKILDKIKMGQEISPFLFMWQNLELVNNKIETLANELLEFFNIPKVNLMKLEDSWEKIKISEIKNFMKISDSTTPYKIQIFLIENFSRITIQWSNSCLKKFEEPWIQNIYFITNNSESGILETILSRVQTINLWLQKQNIKSEFHNNLLNESIKKGNSKNLISYFFKSKIEKEEYILFLNTLIDYSKNNLIFINYLEEIFDDLSMIQSNNLLAKITVDKWILRIINE